jgi:flagellum-specific ATP synthase
MEAVGLRLPIGSTCSISQPGTALAEAEVVGFSGDRLFLMPASDIYGLTPGAKVTALEAKQSPPGYVKPAHPWRRVEDRAKHLPVGDLLGRVLDGSGRPLDKLGPLRFQAQAPLQSRPVNPIDREPIGEPLDVGVRAINALLTVGRGQRMGLFAGSGVGKSVLLGMMARYTSADVIVVGLIGERGREVKEFIENILGEKVLPRRGAAAPADTPPLLRLQGAAYATTIAEYFRTQGKHVLLIMDSLTRYAMAQREIALALNEPPATKGYPPSVFAKLPQLVERAGNGSSGGGSITPRSTRVLTEGDVSRIRLPTPLERFSMVTLYFAPLLRRGHYPAIDIEQSVSRASAFAD